MNAGLEKYPILFLSWSAVIVSLASLRFTVVARVDIFFMVFVMGMCGQWCFSTKEFLAVCQHCKSSGSLRRMIDDRGD
jgi:hypothetical protein